MPLDSATILAQARNCLAIERDALAATAAGLSKDFVSAVQAVEAVVRAGKKLIISGVGKNAHIAQKLAGTFNSIANTSFRIEFFANTALGFQHFGEGQTFIGSTTVTTDGSGNTSFSVSTGSPTASGQFITATATDPDGNTSEFSQCAGPHDHLFAAGFEFSCSGG
jgi:hypothetical protein